MRYVATLHYSDALVRGAVFSFWKRSIGWQGIVAFAVSLAGLALMLASGDRSWWVPILGTAVFFMVLLAAMVYINHLRQSLQKLRELKNPVATFTAEEQTFTATSGIGSSTFQWSAVYDIWQFEEYWLLLFSRAQFITLPLVDIPGEMRTFIMERVMATKRRKVS